MTENDLSREGEQESGRGSGCPWCRRLIFLTVFLLGVSSSANAQRVGAPRLGVDGLPLFRDPGSVAVLATATERWKAVSSRSEELLGDFRYLPEYASARAQGQVFQLIRTDGGRLLPDPGGALLVVPWSFGPGCAEEGWPAPEWVTPGDTVTFLLHPTRAPQRAGEALLVFDVLGWHQPYPSGDLIPFWRKTPGPEPRWLTAPEFYQVLAALPDRMAMEAAPPDAMDSMRALLVNSPGLTTAFPVTEMLREWKETWGVELLVGQKTLGPSRRRPAP